MGTIVVSVILEKAAILLEDQGHTTWTLAELLGWVNEGQVAIVGLRPDAKTRIRSIELVAGSRQSIAAPDLRVLDIPRVMVDGESGAARGVVRFMDRSELDLELPTWHSSTPKPDARLWMYDQRIPETFWVWPPNNGAGFVELITSTLPTDCTLTEVAEGTSTSPIDISDIYAPALVDYTVFRAFMRDNEYTQHGGKADLAWRAFMAKLGIKTQADKANRPEKSNPPKYESPRPSNQGVFGDS